MTKREIYKKFTKLSKNELNTKNNLKLNQKIGKIFKKHNPHEEYSVKIFEIDNYFYKHYEKKVQVNKNGCKCISFRIDVYFNKFLLAVEIDEKGLTDRDLFLRKKRQEVLENKIGSKSIRTNTSNRKSAYDLDNEVGNLKKFIDELLNKNIKEIKDKIKEKEEKSNKKIKEMQAKIKEIEDKNKNSTTNQITNNLRKIAIKN